MRRRAALALLAVVGLTQPAAPVPAFEEVRGELAAGRACEAFVSFRGRINPDGARLAAGERYQALGLNRRDGDWLQVVVPGARPAERWVARDCGSLRGEAAPGGPGPPRPFFDLVDAGRDDPTPPPPPLDAFDRAVLGVCGPWGSRPRRATFRAMLDAPGVRSAVEALFGEVRGGQGGLDALKDELARVWFARGAFAHVFCGQPRADGLGGLHYRGRYLELQEQGLAGLAGPGECRAAEVEPPVHTVGVRYRPPRGGPWRAACPKGYAYDLGAADLMGAATRAWAANRRRAAGGDLTCLARVGSGYAAVVVIQDGELRTFYPDATPRCDGGGPPASCACAAG